MGRRISRCASMAHCCIDRGEGPGREEKRREQVCRSVKRDVIPKEGKAADILKSHNNNNVLSVKRG
jgi:hypothetical protein